MAPQRRFPVRTMGMLLLVASWGDASARAGDTGKLPEKATAPIGKWARHYYDRVAQFEKENVPAPRVVMVGSSHVEGFDARWLPGWQVVNRGIASDRIGLTERGILHRLDASVFACDPEVVVLQNGANDLGELWRHDTPTIDEIDACFREVVRRIRNRLPEVPVVLVGMLPTRDRYAGLVPLLLEFDQRLKQIAADLDCTFLEVFPSFIDAEGHLRNDYSRDGLHLTVSGYQVWARMLNTALTEATATAALTPQQDEDGASKLAWHDARDLAVEGRGWADTKHFYERLPARADVTVPPMVWTLASRTAGIAVRFATDSKRIAATWDGGGAMNHMAATGNSGLDLYARHDGQWRFCGVGRPQPKRTTANLVCNQPGVMTDYLLYLPLYSPVTELRIGIEPGAVMTIPSLRPVDRRKPIVFYGTSITQGGCAARAGMCHAAILGRWFDREVINLGFSGAGKMEPALAHLLAELDPALYVLECLPNMTTPMVNERVVPFVRTLRERHPATPILLVESPLHPATNEGNRALQRAFSTLTDGGIGHLYYLSGDAQLASRENGTVDGVHPTDLGFLQMSIAYEPMIQAILGPRVAK